MWPLLVIDATEGLSTQDKKIAAVVDTRNKALIVAVNKWDKMKDSWPDYQKELRIHFPQIAQVPLVAISCKSGKNITALRREIYEVWKGSKHKVAHRGDKQFAKTSRVRQPP